MRNAKGLAQFLSDRKRWSKIIFLFNPFLRKKSTKKKMERESVASSAWSGFWSPPRHDRGQALKSFQATTVPTGARRKRSPRRGTADPPTPGACRILGPARAASRLARLRPCCPYSPYARLVPPESPGRRPHLQPKAQTPAPDKTRSERRGRNGAPPWWRMQLFRRSVRELFMERADYFSQDALRGRWPAAQDLMGNVVLLRRDFGHLIWWTEFASSLLAGSRIRWIRRPLIHSGF